MNWCYSLLNSFNPVDENVTFQINPRPILMKPIFLFSLATEPTHLLLQILHSPLPTMPLLFKPTIYLLDAARSTNAVNGNVVAGPSSFKVRWGRLRRCRRPHGNSVSNWPYVQSLCMRKVAPLSPEVSVFLPPTAVKYLSIPPPTSSFPTMSWYFSACHSGSENAGIDGISASALKNPLPIIYRITCFDDNARWCAFFLRKKVNFIPYICRKYVWRSAVALVETRTFGVVFCSFSVFGSIG